jgi:hypothetical protein
MTAIADAMGVAVDDLDDEVGFLVDPMDVIRHDLADPVNALHAIADAVARSGAPTWRADQGAFAEERGFTNKRREGHVRPSRTPQARRARHLAKQVELGRYPDIETAERMTMRKGANRPS